VDWILHVLEVASPEWGLKMKHRQAGPSVLLSSNKAKENILFWSGAFLIFVSAVYIAFALMQ